jgi:multidrug transporter EmrE-like cation transporter
MYGVAALGIKGLSGVLIGHEPLARRALAAVESPYLYMLGGCALVGFGLFQSALQRCRASIVVPVNNIVGSVYFVVAGSWLFHETLPTDPLRLALRLGGILAAGSVLILLPNQASGSSPTKPRRRPRGPVPASGVTRAPV